MSRAVVSQSFVVVVVVVVFFFVLLPSRCYAKSAS